jgi:hypothetical protein
MARAEITRFSCNHCGITVDISTNQKYPPGWTQFATRRIGPNEEDGSTTSDLCQEHSKGFLDFLHGKNGPHRNQFEARAERTNA